jgi:hypothetical protein
MTSRGMAKHLIVAGLWVLLLSAGSWTVAPAQLTGVQFSTTSLDYDVLYLSDFIEVTTAKLISNIANFSVEVTPVPAGASGQVTLEMTAKMQLKGEPETQLANATTNPFTLKGRRTVSSRDLARGGLGDITIASSNYANLGGKQKFDDYIKRFPSAPVGTYTITLDVYTSPGHARLGGTVIQIVIRNSSPDEVVVTLIDPLPGAVLSTILPTFSWSSPYPNVTLSVYEKLPSMHSPQEAVTGVPHLVMPLTGASTFTYPPTAARHLEMGKTYVWQVTTKVRTNRGDVDRPSEVRAFRILPPSQTLQELEDLLNGLGGAELGTLSTLLGMGWIPQGDITLDGKTLSVEDVAKLLKDLAAKKTPVKARVE